MSISADLIQPRTELKSDAGADVFDDKRKDRGLWRFLTRAVVLGQLVAAEQFIGGGARADHIDEPLPDDSSASAPAGNSKEAASLSSGLPAGGESGAAVQQTAAQAGTSPGQLPAVPGQPIPADFGEGAVAFHGSAPTSASAGAGAGEQTANSDVLPPDSGSNPTVPGDGSVDCGPIGGIVSPIIPPVIDVIGGVTQPVIETVTDVLDGAVDIVANVGDLIDGVLDTVGSTLPSTVALLTDTVGDVLDIASSTVDATLGSLTGVLDTVTNLGDNLSTVANGTLTSVTSTLTATVDTLSGGVSTISDAVGSGVIPVLAPSGLVASATDSLFDGGRYSDLNITLQSVTDLVDTAVTIPGAASDTLFDVIAPGHDVPSGAAWDPIGHQLSEQLKSGLGDLFA